MLPSKNNRSHCHRINDTCSSRFSSIPSHKNSRRGDRLPGKACRWRVLLLKQQVSQQTSPQIQQSGRQAQQQGSQQA